MRTPVLGKELSALAALTWEFTVDVLALLFMLLAVVLFAIAAFAPALHGRLIAGGLACLALSLLLSGLGDVNVEAD